MTFFNKAKDLAKKTADKANEINQQRIDKKEAEIEANKDNPEWLFNATSKVGDLEVDSENNLFRVKNAKSEAFSKKKSFIGKVGSATVAIGTAGMSTAIKATAKALNRKPDSVYTFDELIEFELLEDDSQVSSGGVGRALVGGLAFGAAGAIVGGMTGKKATKKVIESLIIRITINDLDNPIIVLPLITSKTKTDSKDYRNAFNLSQKTVSTLNVITSKKQPEIQKIEVVNNATSSTQRNPYEDVKKAKELLDMGIITEEEFDAKKKELLNL